MDKEIIARPLIDPNLDSYKGFFDHGWCERIFESVRTSPLKDPVGELMLAWRSANGVHLLPWLMTESLRKFATGEAQGSLDYRASYADEVIKGIVNKIEKGMQYSLKQEQRSNLKRVVAKIEKEAVGAMKTAQEQVSFDVERYWRSLLPLSEFQFSILGTQRINYGSLFFAYEDFLANVIRMKEPTYSSKDKKNPIHVAFPNHFGKPLADFCWNHDDVVLTRLVRNALAHNGAWFGKDLEKYKTRFVDVSGTSKPLLRGDRFNIVDGIIQITPDNTTHLFGVLKDRVTKIVEELAQSLAL